MFWSNVFFFILELNLLNNISIILFCCLLASCIYLIPSFEKFLKIFRQQKICSTWVLQSYRKLIFLSRFYKDRSKWSPSCVIFGQYEKRVKNFEQICNNLSQVTNETWHASSSLNITYLHLSSNSHYQLIATVNNTTESDF